VRRTPERIGVPPATTFCRWCDHCQAGGPEALEDEPSRPDRVWNRSRDEARARLIELAPGAPGLSPRELAVRFTDGQGYSVSGASVHRLLKAHDLIASPAFVAVEAADEFHAQTTAPDQLRQTGFTYRKAIGWGWFCLSTILDDFPRYTVAWGPCATMAAGDVTGTLEPALAASGRDRARVRRRPRLLPDDGPGHVATELADWLDGQAIDHARGAPCHPQTQGKVGRGHPTLKNRILLGNHHLPGDLLEARIGAFVEHHGHRRYHGSLGDLTPADVSPGRGQTIPRERARIKRRTIHQRRLLHRKQAA
jgi:transposase InsO family protein